MMPRAPYVSVVDPIGPAIERVKMILFRPFSLERWIVIGFCAWLAHLAEGGGGGGGGGVPGGPGGGPSNFPPSADQARGFVTGNLYWIVPVGILVVLAVIALMLVVAWLRSRGQFMFLYCVAQNKAEVKNPWHLFRHHGNSLFAFRVVFGIITFLTMGVFAGVGVAAFFAARARPELTIASIAAMVACGLLFLTAALVAGVVAKFTKDFVVPIMYLHTTSALHGWRIMLDLLSFNKARFFLYLLFQIVIHLAIGAIKLAATCVTCCCAGCLMLLPYVGAVVLLPISTFQQSYALLYLTQHGPEFNVFAPAPQVTPPAAPPSAQGPAGSLG
jgi:hypothetical protein